MNERQISALNYTKNVSDCFYIKRWKCEVSKGKGNIKEKYKRRDSLAKIIKVSFAYIYTQYQYLPVGISKINPAICVVFITWAQERGMNIESGENSFYLRLRNIFHIKILIGYVILPFLFRWWEWRRWWC